MAGWAGTGNERAPWIGSARRTTAASAGIAALVTVVAFLAPFDFAYRSRPTHVAVETAAALIALVAAYLVFGRFRQSARASDLTLVCALCVLGANNLAFSLVPALSSRGEVGSFATWAPVFGAPLGAALFAAAAFAPERALARPARGAALALALAAGGLAAIGGTVAFFRATLPAAVAATFSPGRLRLVGDHRVLAAQLAGAALFAVATVGFTRRAERRGDELLRWVAAAAALAAAARVNYFLFPSLYSEWVYTGDVLRVGFYLVLLGGAAREIHGYWRGLAHAAVQEERRRLARDLHDGLAQELAYIAARASAAGAAELAAAAGRALDESRRAISALTLTREEPLDVAVAQAAEEVALRAGARVRLELAPGIRRPPDVQEALLRIVREAVTNAVRHGHAEVVRIDLANGNGVRLRIEDDGVGFDATGGGGGGGFGLVSMRERAAALGGELRLASRPGSGTAIEVVVP